MNCLSNIWSKKILKDMCMKLNIFSHTVTIVIVKYWPQISNLGNTAKWLISRNRLRSVPPAKHFSLLMSTNHFTRLTNTELTKKTYYMPEDAYL